MRCRAMLAAGVACAVVLGLVTSNVAPADDGPSVFRDVTGVYSGFFQSSIDPNVAGTLEMRITSQDGPRFSGTASVGIPDASGDIESLLLIVFGEAAQSAQDDLTAIMAGVKAINNAKMELRAQFHTFPGGAALVHVTYNLESDLRRPDRGTAVLLRSYVAPACNPPNVNGSYFGGYSSDDGTRQGFMSARVSGQFPDSPTSFLASASFQPPRSDFSASWNNGRGTIDCNGNAILIFPPNFEIPGPVLQGQFASDGVSRFQGRYTDGPDLLGGSGTFAVQIPSL